MPLFIWEEASGNPLLDLIVTAAIAITNDRNFVPSPFSVVKNGLLSERKHSFAENPSVDATEGYSP